VIIELIFSCNFQIAFFDKWYQSTNSLCYNNLMNASCISRILRVIQAGRQTSVMSLDVNKSSSPASLSVNQTLIGGCSLVNLPGTLTTLTSLWITEVGAAEYALIAAKIVG
jgi:hypothetical protein